MKCNKEIDYSLYLVTDRALLGGRDLLAGIEAAILGGVSVVQLREKEITSREFYQIACTVKALTDRYGIPLIINDRLDIALAVDAAGLHVGQEDLPADVARQLLGPEKILGVSTTTLAESREAVTMGADYLGVGAIFPTGTKLDARYVSLDTLGEIVREIPVPVVAIGGIHAGNAMQVREQQAAGIAVVSAILAQADIRRAAEGLVFSC